VNREKAAEEAEVKKTEREGIAAKNNKGSTEIRPQLGHLAPLPEGLSTSLSPEPAGTSGNITSNFRLPGYNASSITWADLVTEEVFSDSGSAKFTDNASESSEDCIELDFKVEDENRGIASENLDEETRKLIKPE
jgi:hypothetical protein